LGNVADFEFSSRARCADPVGGHHHHVGRLELRDAVLVEVDGPIDHAGRGVDGDLAHARAGAQFDPGGSPRANR
jgi:hypothetical protein